MKRLRKHILVVIGVLALCITPSAWADESTLEFRVAPSADSATSDGGDYFVLSMEPGGVATQSIEVSNPSSQPLDVRVAAVDAATAQMGGVDYGAEQTTPQSTGAWIALEQDHVRLLPGDSAEVGFEVRAPADAVSGTHLAGIVVWVEGGDSQAVQGAPATMKVQSRRVVAVQVELPGPAAPVLEIRGAEAEARPDGLYLGIDIFNTGNGFAKGTGTVSIDGGDAQATFALDTIVPRTGTTYPFRWASSSIPSGEYEVSITVDYGVGSASYEGKVVVGSAVQGDLRGRGVGEGTRSGQTRFVVVGALVLVAIAAFFLRKRFTFAPALPRLRRVSLGPAPRPTGLSLRPAPQHTVVTLRAPRSPAIGQNVPLRMEVQRRFPPPPPPPPARLIAPPPPAPARPIAPPPPPLTAGRAA